MKIEKIPLTITSEKFLFSFSDFFLEYQPNEKFDLSSEDDKEFNHTDREVQTLLAQIHGLQTVSLNQQREIERLEAIINYLEKK